MASRLAVAWPRCRFLTAWMIVSWTAPGTTGALLRAAASSLVTGGSPRRSGSLSRVLPRLPNILDQLLFPPRLSLLPAAPSHDEPAGQHGAGCRHGGQYLALLDPAGRLPGGPADWLRRGGTGGADAGRRLLRGPADWFRRGGPGGADTGRRLLRGPADWLRRGGPGASEPRRSLLLPLAGRFLHLASLPGNTPGPPGRLL